MLAERREIFPLLELCPYIFGDDERVAEWDGNFRSDGALMIACCERSVDIKEYRRVLVQSIAYRNRVQKTTDPRSWASSALFRA